MAGSDDSNSVVIVALPEDNDPVRKFSSEPEPHLTLLYLGDAKFDDNQFALLTGYVEYASTLLNQFSLEVLDRGELGGKKADVLFFSKNWSKQITRFRDQLLQEPNINAAYNSSEQFEGWTPHLTLGYPDNPAKIDESDRAVYSVRFDRIAVWNGNYSGPTYKLDPFEYGDLDVAMTSLTEDVDYFLSHYGVKGMKWGVRRADSNSGSSSEPPAKSSADAKLASASQAKINSGGIHTVSNQELQHLVIRMNLERQYGQMKIQNKSELDKGLQATQKILKVGKTVEDVRKFLETPTGQNVKRAIKGSFTVAKIAAAAYTGGGSAAAAAGASAAVRRVVGGVGN